MAIFVFCFAACASSHVWLPLMGWRIAAEETRYNDSRIALLPADGDPKHQVLEYDDAIFNMKVSNLLDTEITITSVKGSCGCISFMESSDRPLRLPCKVKARGSLPFSVVVKTGGAVGLQMYRVAVMAALQGNELTATSEVKVDVIAGLRIEPASVAIVRGENPRLLGAELSIYDAYPGDGVPIKSITTTKPEWLSITVKDSALLSGRESSGSSLYPAGLKHRKTLVVSLTPEGNAVRGDSFGSILISPASSRHPLVEIPVAISTKRSDIRVVPTSVIVPVSSKTSAKRTSKTVYLYAQADHDELKVLSTPNGVVSRPVPTGDPKVWKVVVEVNPTQVAARERSLLVQFADQPGNNIEIPIKIINLE